MERKWMSVHEVAELTGVTVRTLHYYDEIGLLKPAKLTESGYRLYDEAGLIRLQNILQFRELEFPLKEIRTILDSPDFDPSEALEHQIRLLELQREHIEKLIDLAREIQRKGVKVMHFDAFDKSDIEKYEAEVVERWGDTPAYREYQKKEAAQNQNSCSRLEEEMIKIFSELGGMKDLAPEDDEVQHKVSELQHFITEHFYDCTKEILSDLGEMYVSDERFMRRIDQAGGIGTADFVHRAIAAYCS